MLPDGISVCFNGSSGLMRRPIAHTYSCSLELPSTYVSYVDFECELHAVLSDNEYNWQMNVIRVSNKTVYVNNTNYSDYLI